MPRLAVYIFAILLGGILVGTYFWTPLDPRARFAQCGGSAVGGDIGGAFELTNGAGQTVSDRDVLNKPALVYFGYTFCPDVCPFDMARNADAVDLLAARGWDVTPVFITLDPQRDTPEVVNEFATAMHPNAIGLTGSQARIEQAKQAYRAYSKIHDTGDEYYLVDHSTFTYLMLPDSGFAEFFRREDSAGDMAQRTACFLSAAGGIPEI